MGQRRAPKEVGMGLRKWHVAALGFSVMGPVEGSLSFSCEDLELVE